jgi:two-component system phosphate regulon response regulator OmpR
MTAQPHILIVDDEPEIRDMIGEYLELNGLAVTPLENGEALRAFIAAHNADLVLLDINMPGEDGLSLARFLRQSTDVGIIMLTAAGETVDRIVGLEIGADDYLAKPVDLRELLARVRAVLRRRLATAHGAVDGGAGTNTGDEIAFGRCRLNLASRKLIEADGQEVPLTSMEFDLLKAFADHPNRILTRDQLLDLAHDRTWEPFDRSIDIRIARIRRKIEADPTKPQVIKTVRGVGYVYASPGPDARRGLAAASDS